MLITSCVLPRWVFCTIVISFVVFDLSVVIMMILLAVVFIIGVLLLAIVWTSLLMLVVLCGISAAERYHALVVLTISTLHCLIQLFLCFHLI